MSAKNIVDLRGAKTKGAAAPKPHPVQVRPVSVPTRADIRRASPTRARRRKKRLILATITVVLIGAIAFAISYVSYLPRFSIATIDVVGTQTVPADFVKTYVESELFTAHHPYLSPYNIFLYHRVGLQNEIVGYFPRIKSAAISRDSLLSTHLTVTITEREPFARWCNTLSDCFEMDPSGYIFAQAPESTSTVAYTTNYVFFGAVSTSSSPITQTFVGAHVPGIVALLKSLETAGFKPTGATVIGGQDFTVHLVDGFDIKASFGEDSSGLVSNLKLILNSDSLNGKESDLEYVDLRFGDRVYYKLSGEASSDTASSTPAH